MSTTDNKRSVTDFDRTIGGRLRQLRERRGVTQEEVSELLGVTFQQFGKYERGINRIPLSRVLALCAILRMDVSTLVKGIPLDVDLPKMVTSNRRPSGRRVVSVPATTRVVSSGKRSAAR